MNFKNTIKQIKPEISPYNEYKLKEKHILINYFEMKLRLLNLLELKILPVVSCI